MAQFPPEVLAPARRAGETFSDYVSRREVANDIARRYIQNGIVSHVSAQIVRLPPQGADEQVDEAIKIGQYRDVTTVTEKSGKERRIGRTKGVTYRKGNP